MRRDRQGGALPGLEKRHELLDLFVQRRLLHPEDRSVGYSGQRRRPPQRNEGRGCDLRQAQRVAPLASDSSGRLLVMTDVDLQAAPRLSLRQHGAGVPDCPICPRPSRKSNSGRGRRALRGDWLCGSVRIARPGPRGARSGPLGGYLMGVELGEVVRGHQ